MPAVFLCAAGKRGLRPGASPGLSNKKIAPSTRLRLKKIAAWLSQVLPRFASVNLDAQVHSSWRTLVYFGRLAHAWNSWRSYTIKQRCACHW
jgi:hypothetical protein